MFGNRRNKDQGSLSQAMKPENPPSSGKGGSSVTGFDPEGLERAAKAARDLDASRNAGSAIELIKTQEATKQHEAASKRAEYDAYVEQQRASNIKQEADEARKTLEAQTQHEKHRADYGDELERKRQVDMLNAQKYMQEEQLKKQEEMVARQEAMRRKTAEHEAELRTRTELAKVGAEAEGRIRQERENHDLILEKVKLEAIEKRDTALKALKDGGKMLGEGLASYLEDREKLRNTALLITAVAGGIYVTKTGVGITGRFVEARLGKPSLVRETSRIPFSALWKSPITSAKRILGTDRVFGSRGKAGDAALKGIVLEESLESRLKRVAVSTANTKRNRAPFRHLLLHGPPGTGKTLFARSLARNSGLDFAVFTGGDIAPLGRDAVTELHKLFDWAKTSRRGLLLFVDEADAFLQSRENAATTGSVGGGISEDQRNALNAFLFRTGTESDQFMMVYASNQPSQFDEAIMDRIDEMVEFGLPAASERKKMIVLYVEKYLLNPPSSGMFATAKKVSAVDIGEDEIDQAVAETEGFSGRAISKLAIAWQAAAYGTEGAVLDRDTFFRTLEDHKKSMTKKDEWLERAKARADMLTTDR